MFMMETLLHTNNATNKSEGIFPLGEQVGVIPLISSKNSKILKSILRGIQIVSVVFKIYGNFILYILSICGRT